MQPSRSSSITVHTNRFAAIDARIMGVKGSNLKGVFSKTHCWNAVYGLVSRSMRPSAGSHGDVMIPPAGNPDLVSVEKYGMWVSIGAWEGVRDHPDVLEEIMRSENSTRSAGFPRTR